MECFTKAYLFSDCPFVTKAKHAENAGAIGVLIADNDFSNDEITVNMIGDDSVTQVSIPAGLMLAEDRWDVYYLEL